MSLIRASVARAAACAVAAVAGWVAFAPPAAAVPAYARQTGQNCVACHVSFPELTPYGRYFKLSGYTLGDGKTIPLAVMVQQSYTSIRNNVADDGTGDPVIDRNRSLIFNGASLFLAGKAGDNAGAFVQWTYDSLAHHSSIDNTDLRVVGRYIGAASGEPDLIYGATLHNNPTAQDAWNSTPAFGFPFTSSPVAPTPAAATLIDGGLGQQVAGLGGYAWWQKALYGELTLYRPAIGALSILRAGPSDPRIGGTAPYARIAWSHDWDVNSAEVGGFWLRAKRWVEPTDPTLGADRLVDFGLDAQFQSIGDPHTWTAQFTWLHEKQALDASFADGVSANTSNTLKTLKLKGTYYFQRKYGATLAWQNTTGTADNLLYPSGLDPDGVPLGFAASNVPDSSAWTLELNYLPVQNVRLMLQYIAYTKFNGGRTNYDGSGRNARDNNTLFLNAWIAY
jgi:hypothetical protein